MRCLSALSDPNVLVGFAAGDDAAVYRLAPDLAIVQSVDIMAPVVDDPRVFGQIAAANALSDIYAMGAQPLTALNVLAVPPGQADLEVAAEILRGGCEKLTEGGAVVLGGHTIEDPEFKYGACVTGTAHPDRILTNAGAKPGDGLVLTKPLGTGVIATAIKGGLASEDHAAAAAASMAQLNAVASRAAIEGGAHACTDVTGFGLIGHLIGMLVASKVGAVVEAARVPLLPGAPDYAGMGLLCRAVGRMRYQFSCQMDVKDSVSNFLLDLLYDPQTSGGLLVSVAEPEVLVQRLHAEGIGEAAVVGRVVAEPTARLAIV